MSEKDFENKQIELSNCTFVKTILMISVVFYHCILSWSGNWFMSDVVMPSYFLTLLAKWLDSFHIYGFTLISGYIFYYLKYEKEKYQTFREFFVIKVKRLLVPYVFVALIWVIPFSDYFYDYTVTEIVTKFMLGMSPGQLWFLLMLFSVFIIWWPLSDFFKKNNGKGAVVILLLYGIGLIGQLVHINIFQIFRSCVYICFFWIGFKIRQYGSGYIKKIPIHVWIIIDFILFFIVEYISLYEGQIISVIEIGFKFILNIVGAIMSFLVLQNFAEHFSWSSNKIFMCLSKKQMPIYLFHQQIIYVCVYKLYGLFNPYIHVLINFITTMLITLLVSTVLMKYDRTRKLIGEK